MKRMLMVFLLALAGLARADVATPSRLTVTLDANGGSVSRRTINYSNMSSALNLPKPTRSGYVFKYWTTVNNNPSTKIDSSMDAWDLAIMGQKTKIGGSWKSYSSTITLYAYWGLQPPTPSASDGKYSTKVRITWPAVAGASKYKVRRATSNNYNKSETIATITGRTYHNDKHPAKRTGKKYYYWILPFDRNGVWTKDATRGDSGYAK